MLPVLSFLGNSPGGLSFLEQPHSDTTYADIAISQAVADDAARFPQVTPELFASQKDGFAILVVTTVAKPGESASLTQLQALQSSKNSCENEGFDTLLWIQSGN